MDIVRLGGIAFFTLAAVGYPTALLVVKEEASARAQLRINAAQAARIQEWEEAERPFLLLGALLRQVQEEANN